MNIKYIFLIVILSIEIMNIMFNRKHYFPFTLIERKYKIEQHKYYNQNLKIHFIVLDTNCRNNVSITEESWKYFIEENTKYDDILFLIPLYNIIVNTEIIVICSDRLPHDYVFKQVTEIKDYMIYNNCIYFNIDFLKYLHLHSDIFKLCKYIDIYYILSKRQLSYRNSSICSSNNFSNDYSVVTTVFRRNNFELQMNYFSNQDIPPKHIIIVHDRNAISVPFNKYKIVYVHTMNFAAGYYFRYLISLISQEENIIMYDDDFFPSFKNSHSKWFYNIKNKFNYIIGNRYGVANEISWCATPLFIHRKWMYLLWYNKIYNTKTIEDGHLSFTLLLFCNIKCLFLPMNGLKSKEDNLSSSINNNITRKNWELYTNDTKNKINSIYIQNLKKKYLIY